MAICINVFLLIPLIILTLAGLGLITMGICAKTERGGLILTGLPCTLIGTGTTTLAFGHILFGKVILAIGIWMIACFLALAYFAWWRELRRAEQKIHDPRKSKRPA